MILAAGEAQATVSFALLRKAADSYTVLAVAIHLWPGAGNHEKLIAGAALVSSGCTRHSVTMYLHKVRHHGGKYSQLCQRRAAPTDRIIY